MKNKVLTIAVHPDDETLGCGGTLFKHKANGDSINWLICTTISKSDKYYKTREKEINKVRKAYGFDKVYSLDLETTRVDEYSASELISSISSVVQKVKPNIVYLPFKGDIHSDHKHIFDAAYSCTKIFRYPFIKKIYMMETLSETEFSLSHQGGGFIPNVFVDVSEFIDKKIELMNIYKSEIDKHPFPRSERNIKALAIHRGATSGCNYAEGFVLLKEVL